MNKFRKPHGNRRENRFGGDRQQNSGKSSFGNKPAFGGRPSFGGKPPFRKPGFGGSSSSGFRREETEMFEATCANCGKTCQVPFRPNGRKPVYCNDCFNGRTPSASPVPQQKTFIQRDTPLPTTPLHTSPNEQTIMELKRQMNAINTKIDTILRIVESLKHTAPVPTIASSIPTPTVKTSPKEVVKKKVSKKGKLSKK